MEYIGRYKILDEVGRGAMGIVYRAQDPAIGRNVALKTIRLSELVDVAERAKLRDRLFREAQSAGMLSHPGIVTIYDIAEEGDMAYITMEFVDGPTLDRLLSDEPADGKLVLSILSQTAAALDYAHKRGIVHRDIKPANIMIHESTTAKITDFGVARIQSHQLTHAGSMVGTPNYMSPEQIQGQPVTGAADQFSLAVIAYEMLTGEKPFSGDTMPALAFKIVHDEPVPVQRLNSTLGWAVDTVLKRALSKDAADRYPTCSDFVVALDNACRSCKGWRAISPGALLDLPTFAGAVSSPPPPPPPAELPNEPTAAAPAENQVPVAEVPFEDPEPPPAFLRIARIMAVIVLVGGVIAVLLVYGLEYFSARNEEPPSGVRSETQTRPDPKPNPVASQPGLPEPPSAPAPQLPAAEPTGRSADPPLSREPAETRLTTNPAGAYIVVDGKSELSCVSPCGVSLPPGRHTLAATKEGHRRALRIFQTPADAEIFLNLEQATGKVFLQSTPSGASISVDGQLRSEKTPATLTLSTGSHKIELVRDGARETEEIVVKDSSITNLTIDMGPGE